MAEIVNGGFMRTLFTGSIGEICAVIMKRNPMIYITHKRAEAIDSLGLKAKMPANWDGQNVLARHEAAGYTIRPINLSVLDGIYLLSDHENIRAAIDKFAAKNKDLMSIEECVAMLTT